MGIAIRYVEVEGATRSATPAMTEKGHEDQFRPPSLSGGCRLGKATFAGMGGKEKDAPIAVINPGVQSLSVMVHS